MSEINLIQSSVGGDAVAFELPFVERYAFFANKSSENVLEMCKVVYEAFNDLKPEAFQRFCTAIGVGKKAASVSKMRKIGERYSFLKGYSDHLPSAWTTLYRLSRIENEVFETGILDGVIHPSMNARALSILDPKVRKETTRTNQRLVTITLPGELDEQQKAGLMGRLNDVMRDFYSEIEQAAV